MLPDFAIPALAASLGLVALMSAMLVLTRIQRARRESQARVRRDHYLRVLIDGSPAEVADIARRACRSAHARADLLRCAVSELPNLDRGRAGLLRRASAHARLDRWARGALSARSAVTRGRAVLLAGHVCGLGAAELEPLLFDRDRDVRLAAAGALSAQCSHEGAWALLHALRDGAMPPERIVERLTGEWALDALLEACAMEEYRPVRPELIQTLGLIGDPRPSGFLLTMLVEGVDEERVRAARALGTAGSRAAVPALTRALDDPFSPVRAQAARSLGLLRANSALDSIVGRLGDPSWWVRANCAEALRALGPDGLEALTICAIDHPDRYARDRAAEALALEGALMGGTT